MRVLSKAMRRIIWLGVYHPAQHSMMAVAEQKLMQFKKEVYPSEAHAVCCVYSQLSSVSVATMSFTTCSNKM